MIGNPDFRFRVTGADPAALLFLNLGLPSGGLICGSCTYTNPVALELKPNVAGTATSSFALPCDPALVNFQLESQWLSIGTAFTPCPLLAGVSGSNRLLFTLANGATPRSRAGVGSGRPPATASRLRRERAQGVADLHPGIDASQRSADNGRMDRNRMFVLGTWMPATFCFVLAVVQLVHSLSATGISSAYLFFLPMCFVYAGIGNLALHRRVVELEARLPPSTPAQPR